MKNMTNGDKLGIGIKVENYKKGKQQQVFEILDKEGYISDTKHSRYLARRYGKHQNISAFGKN